MEDGRSDLWREKGIGEEVLRTGSVTDKGRRGGWRKGKENHPKVRPHV